MVKRFTEKGSEDTRLLVAAARQGYAPAQYQLGLDMESGQLHPEVAYMLFSLAARNGDEAAGKSLESLRNRMSELQIEVGERMIGDWDTRWHNGREQSKARTQ
jgi:TPR repeat protein